ncbi:MAG: hypothetical protein IT342_13145 [Candidatus Melainabacteria bacterium]|nr:hypothetical protein [Candidatus Melainabacteria bacterium]
MQSNRSISYALTGNNLSEEQKAKLESYLTKNPKDLNARIILLGGYSEFKPSEQNKRLEHIEWIIENHPEHAIAGTPFAQVNVDDCDYQSTSVLWMEQAEKHKNKLRVLVNAANFFTHRDKDLAEDYYKKALFLDPNNQDIKHQLAHLYTLFDGHEKQALAQLEEVCTGPESEDFFYEMSNLPSTAFAAGNIERAISSANKLLDLSEKYRTNWNYGNAVNKTHTVLGRVAIKNGDIEAAKNHLRLSIIDIATPQTTSFGPSLDLAKELAKAGEKGCVIDYLDAFEQLCGVDNNWACELRYTMEHSGERAPAHPPEREHYVDCKLEHQLAALQAWDATKRAKHLKELIKSTKDNIETWARRVEESKGKENKELFHYASHTLEAERKHLINLEALAQKESGT